MPVYEYKCRICEEVQAITRYYMKDRNKEVRCVECGGESILVASVCGLITIN